MTAGHHALARRWPLRLAAALAAVLVLLTLAVALHERDEMGPLPQAALPQDTALQRERGAYLARLGNCGGCHTARGGAAYAGGRAIATPFGRVYSSNLTPDLATGLGTWRSDDFFRALHHGRGRDGRRLLPAFPYTAFTRITREDSDALFAFLRSLPPVVQPPTEHEVPALLASAPALALWRLAFFRAGADADEPGRSPEWARGRYLVRGLGHCGACHAPRNLLGAGAEELTGGPLPDRRWTAPSLQADAPGPAAQADFVAAMKTGHHARGSVSGPMAAIVRQSTQHWTDADLQAAAVYLQSLPRVAPVPAAGPPARPEQLALGQRLYADRCADCHGADGEGAPGAYAPLAGNPTVLEPSPANLVQMLVHGGFAPATVAQPRPYGMPPQELSDDEIAALASWLRQAWGGRAGAVTAAQVFRLR